MSSSFNSADIETLRSELPAFLWRHKWPEYNDKYGLPLSRGTMANLDCRGTGPKRGLLQCRVFYRRSDYLMWLESLS